MNAPKKTTPPTAADVRLSRRGFVQASASIASGLAVIGTQSAHALQATSSESFQSNWADQNNRVWLGEEYWANPLQDWRVQDGRIECIHAAPDRNVHLITYDLSDEPGDLQLTVRVGRIDGKLGEGRGSAGFRIGAVGPLREYRNNLIFGRGIDAGLLSTGHLFVGNQSNRSQAIDLNRDCIDLKLIVEAAGERSKLTLTAIDCDSGEELGTVTDEDIVSSRLVGNLALVSNYGMAAAATGKGNAKGKGKRNSAVPAGLGEFWFSDWKSSGSKLRHHPERAFGPILFSQYTLSRGTLKISAQMPPLGAKDSQTVRLQLEETSGWTSVGESPIEPEARTATFVLPNWDSTREVNYRLAYTALSQHSEAETFWHGTIRKDPVDQPSVTVGDVSCNIHAAFPNAQYVAHMAKLNPDFLAFVGDQFYESSGGYGVIRTPVGLAILDYLRKWYLHGWTWRELMKDRPSISLPDDHDVYQGNVWGESGAAREGTQEMGGYDMPPAWVNVVHTTQTSHHPDPFDPRPVKQGIKVYFGALTYGGISFAILADRMFKSGPEGKVPKTSVRGDHVTDPNFDPKSADLDGLELLGERQLGFLREWIEDWHGADMKAVISQTIFTAMATTHGAERMRLVADYDTNGWPQTARNQALRIIRKAFAVHIAGDQHLPAVVHYGIDQHRDAGIAFAGPAVNVGYPRWWEPETAGKNRAADAAENTGDFTDHFGNPLTVVALKNGAVKPAGDVLELMQQKASGLGVVRFDKRDQSIAIECWPFLADPNVDEQFPGWPVKVLMLANYGRSPVAYLPKLILQGVKRPVIKILADDTNELVYVLRCGTAEFRPHVFTAGKYTIEISDDAGKTKRLTGIQAAADNQESLRIDL